MEEDHLQEARRALGGTFYGMQIAVTNTYLYCKHFKM
jgi:hypothetical protein